MLLSGVLGATIYETGTSEQDEFRNASQITNGISVGDSPLLITFSALPCTRVTRSSPCRPSPSRFHATWGNYEGFRSFNKSAHRSLWLDASTRRGRREAHLIRSRPRSSWAFRPTKVSPSTAPAITRVCFGRPVPQYTQDALRISY